MTSNSLPKPQTPTFLPASLQDRRCSVSFQDTRQRARSAGRSGRCRRGPSRPSRASRTFGHPADRELGAVGLPSRPACGTTSGPPATHRDRQVLGRVVALLVGREVAGELGLRRPLELEPDRRAARRPSWRRRRRRGRRSRRRRRRCDARRRRCADGDGVRAARARRPRRSPRTARRRRASSSSCVSSLSGAPQPVRAPPHIRRSLRPRSEGYRSATCRDTRVRDRVASRVGSARDAHGVPRDDEPLDEPTIDAGRRRCPSPRRGGSRAQVMSKRSALALVTMIRPRTSDVPAEVLADDRADQAQASLASLRAGEEVRQGVRDRGPCAGPSPRVAAYGAHQLEGRRLDLDEAAGHVGHDREEHEDGRHHHLRQRAEQPEPVVQQRRERR